jgi:exonuclease III
MRIFTWNILSQTTLPPESISFAERLPQIIKTIQQADADFVLLQEVNIGSFKDDFASLFCVYHYAHHHLSKKHTCLFGNATFWKSQYGESKQIIERSRSLHVVLPHLLITNVHFPAGSGFQGYKNRLTHLTSAQKIWQTYNNCIMGGDFNEGCWNPFGLILDLRQDGFLFDDNPKLTCCSLRDNKPNVYDIDHICVKSN